MSQISATGASASSASSGAPTGQQQQSGGQPGSPDLFSGLGGAGGGGGGQGGSHFGGRAKDGGTQAGGGERGGQGGGEAFDYRGAFRETQGSLQKMTQDFGRLKEQQTSDSQLLSKMREVFNPQEQHADPTQGKISQYEQMLDYYIAQGVEAEKSGRAMPLTINNGIQMYRSLIDAAQREQQLESRLSQMQQQLQKLDDPRHIVNQQAFQTVDTHIKRALDSLYGNTQDSLPQRRAVFQSIGAQVAPVINRLIQQDPARWDMISRDPEALQELANRAVRSHVPPRALQMIAEENMRNTPMPVSELRQAMRELRANPNIPAEQKAELETELRQKIWEQMYRGGGLKVG